MLKSRTLKRTAIATLALVGVMATAHAQKTVVLWDSLDSLNSWLSFEVSEKDSNGDEYKGGKYQIGNGSIDERFFADEAGAVRALTINTQVSVKAPTPPQEIFRGRPVLSPSGVVVVPVEPAEPAMILTPKYAMASLFTSFSAIEEQQVRLNFSFMIPRYHTIESGTWSLMEFTSGLTKHMKLNLKEAPNGKYRFFLQNIQMQESKSVNDDRHDFSPGEWVNVSVSYRCDAKNGLIQVHINGEEKPSLSWIKQSTRSLPNVSCLAYIQNAADDLSPALSTIFIDNEQLLKD